MSNQRLKLSDLRDGECAVIESQELVPSNCNLELLDGVSPRYGELGFIAGAKITRVCAAPWFGDPIIFQVNQTRISLRKTECEQFVVRLLA